MTDLGDDPGPPTVEGTCRRIGCPIAEGGQGCALGHENPLDCAEFEPSSEGSFDDEVNEDLDGPVAEEPADPAPVTIPGRRPFVAGGERISLTSGVDFTPEEAALLYCDRAAVLAVPIGEVDVGKTTLIAALYEALSRGSIDDWMFAGSETLLGFEDRCFWATPASGGAEAEMPHTRYGYAGYLHLALRKRGGDERLVDLLLAEVSGEHLVEFTRQNEPGELERPLRSADVVVLLVSGEKLADPSQKWATIANARTALRTCEERINVSRHATVLAVVTKWDLCVGRDGIDETVGRLHAELDTVVPGIGVFTTAARPITGSALQEGFGLNRLLADIIANASRTRHAEARTPGPTRLPQIRPGGALLRQLVEAAHERPA